MAHIGCLALVTLVAGGLSGCLLDTEPVNHRPSIKVSGPSMIMRSGSAVFSAVVSDPDEDWQNLAVAWHFRRGDQVCPKTLEAADVAPSQRLAADQSFTPPLDFVDAFCVWAVVKDRRGAGAFAKIDSRVANAPPTAAISVLQPASPAPGGLFPLYVAFEISGAPSADPDGDPKDLTFEWRLARPNAAAEPAPTCSTSKNVCFSADVPGVYTISLTVRDSFGGEGQASMTLNVDEDRPPCIGEATPRLVEQLVRRAEDPLRLEVLAVADDGDPYVASRPVSQGATFGWQWRHVGDRDFTRSPITATSKSAVLEFPPNFFLIGDVVEVRVHYQDRVARSFTACDEAKATCELDPRRPDCHQWVTWKIAFND